MSRPPPTPPSDEWRDATQAYQAQVIRFHVETLRRLKYRPTGGFCQFLLADAQPAVTCSVLDDRRRPKAGWAALVDACAPVIVVADRPAGQLPARRGHGQLAVHVVSDLRVAHHAAARSPPPLSWPGASATWRFAGEVPADSCARVGVVRSSRCADEPGPLHLDLDLTWPGGKRTTTMPAR